MTAKPKGKIPATFELVDRKDYGYNTKQVDAFMANARNFFEAPELATKPVNSGDVRAVAFDPIKGGYNAVQVDDALDVLEDALARKERDELVAAEGEEAWLQRIGKMSATLRGRLHRPASERFRSPSKNNVRGYRKADVDALCEDLIGYLEKDKPLSVDNVRRAVFRSAQGTESYEEAQVDAFLDRAVELMAAID
ncbi:DivIVA domain-containing protein [Pseudarthrobacter sp. J1738]|uniref:DivIVA domain-containing protein n=1 Tax=Pseudarthrobacter sp. J1738 TaxID=3420446 RepID=UPI003D2AC2AB